MKFIYRIRPMETDLAFLRAQHPPASIEGDIARLNELDRQIEAVERIDATLRIASEVQPVRDE